MNEQEPKPEHPEPAPPAAISSPGAPAEDRDIFGRTPKHHADWSHRRGEPRLFALLWTIYLMAATLLMFARSGGIGSFNPEGYRPAARTTMVLLAVGTCILWPMVRLSQYHPTRRVLRSCLRDAVVITVPMQALIWPQKWLARWPLDVVAALSATLIAWAIVVAALLALLMPPERGTPPKRRFARSTLAMAACIILFLGTAAVATALEGAAAPADALDTKALHMLSPVTAVIEITRDRPWTGAAAAVSKTHWNAVLLTAAAGTGLLLAAAVAQAFRRSPDPSL